MTRSLLSRRLAAAAISGAIIASATSHAEEVTFGQTLLASGLGPAEGSNGRALVTRGIAEQLFRVSREGELVSNLAASATQNDDGTWTVELAPDRFFSDGTPVTA